ncbi:hypothetical protein ACWEQP_26860 [Streptomyces sp. NPDC004044]
MNKLVVATSDRSQVIKNGWTATFRTPQADGKQAPAPGEYADLIKGQITVPGPAISTTGAARPSS